MKRHCIVVVDHLSKSYIIDELIIKTPNSKINHAKHRKKEKDFIIKSIEKKELVKNTKLLVRNI